jgi:glycosyltransferase involved in cell wall biosynthesis
MNSIKEKLESLGHEVDILGKLHGGLGYQIINKNWVVKNKQLLPILNNPLNKNNVPQFNAHQRNRYCMELAAIYFGLEKYDIIHTHDVISTRCLSRVKPKKTPLIASIHGALARESTHSYKTPNPNAVIQQIKKTRHGRYYWTLEKLGLNSADLIHTSSYWMRNLIIKDYGVSDNGIVSFQYGIDIEKFLAKMNNKTGINKPLDRKVILYTGRLVQIKGINFLIHALSHLKRVRNDWVCWIVGEGIMKNELQQLSAQLGLNRYIKFLGARDDVPALLKLADIFVLPSLQDNMPLSIIEAQLAGKAIVTSNAGGIPEMVNHGVTGLIAPAGRITPLYKHIKTLIENDSFRNGISSNTKEWAMQHWSIDLMIDRILTIYKQMLFKNLI